ncbi:MAG: M35 family metallo-endopeptidase [Pseudomonadota bacterium]
MANGMEWDMAAIDTSPVAPGVDYRLSAFPSFDTALIPAHGPILADIADRVVASQAGARRIRCVRLIGHSATWRGITTETYFQRAMARAYAALRDLERRLTAQNLTVAIQAERPGEPCRPRAGVDVTLHVGSRGNQAPIVPNLVDRTDRAARDNRALNRRVDITLMRVARPRPRPRPRPEPPKRRVVRLSLLYRGDTTDDVKRLARATGRACHAARKRMRTLAAMDDAARRAAWNAGPEAIWFGPYDDGGAAPFPVVRRFVERMFEIVQGKRRPGRSLLAERARILTLESVRGGHPGRRACRARRDLPPPLDKPPVERWIDAARATTGVPLRKLRSEDRQADALHIRCAEQATMGLAFRTLDVDMAAPRRTRIEPAPHKIMLCPAWFREPRTPGRRRRWAWTRRRTIAHELAHLAGVAKLEIDPLTGDQKNAEIYGERAIKRLARRRPHLARANAENYGAYVMSFGAAG